MEVLSFSPPDTKHSRHGPNPCHCQGPLCMSQVLNLKPVLSICQGSIWKCFQEKLFLQAKPSFDRPSTGPLQMHLSYFCLPYPHCNHNPTYILTLSQGPTDHPNPAQIKHIRESTMCNIPSFSRLSSSNLNGILGFDSLLFWIAKTYLELKFSYGLKPKKYGPSQAYPRWKKLSWDNFLM